jgi:hypothetical protein
MRQRDDRRRGGSAAPQPVSTPQQRPQNSARELTNPMNEAKTSRRAELVQGGGDRIVGVLEFLGPNRQMVALAAQVLAFHEQFLAPALL